MVLLELGPVGEGSLNEGAQACVGCEKGQRHKLRALGHELGLGIEMQDAGKLGGGDLLVLEGLTECYLERAGLRLDAELVALEGDAGSDGPVQLLLVILRRSEGLPADVNKRLRTGKTEESAGGSQDRILALAFQSLIGGGDLLPGGEGFVDSVAEVDLGDYRRAVEEFSEARMLERTAQVYAGAHDLPFAVRLITAMQAGAFGSEEGGQQMKDIL